MTQRDYATVLQAGKVLHLYVNSSIGNDANNGLTAGTAKKTIAEALKYIPNFIDKGSRIIVHLSGSFDEAIIFTKVICSGCNVIFDGGDDYETVLGPHTADISSTGTIGLSSLNLEVDAYFIYGLEILSGPCIGEVKGIYSNTNNTFTVEKDFSTNPGNANFRIIKPGASFTGSTTTRSISLSVLGSGELYFQKIQIDGTKVQTLNSGSVIRYTSCLINKTNSSGLNFFRIPTVVLQGRTYNMSGSIPALFSATILFYTCSFNTGTTIYLYGGGSSAINGGRIGPGLLIQDSTGGIDSGLTINNCTSHAIEIINSTVLINGAIAVTGNGGAGVYAHDKSLLKTKAGTPANHNRDGWQFSNFKCYSSRINLGKSGIHIKNRRRRRNDDSKENINPLIIIA